MTSSLSYKNNFNLLRLISAFLVLISHCYELLNKLAVEPLYYLTSGALRFSTIGLYCFFFTSGLLVSNSFLKSKSIVSFLWKRLLRIYPALICVVLLTVFIIGPTCTNLHVDKYFLTPDTYKYLITGSGFLIRFTLPGVFSDAAFADNGVNGSLWSLSLELKLYVSLILIGIVYRINRGIGKWLPLVATILFSLLVQMNVFELQLYFDELHCRLISIFFIGYLFNFFKETLLLNFKIMVAIIILYVFTLLLIPTLKFFSEPLFFGYLAYFLAIRTKEQLLKMDISYGIYIYAFLVTQLSIYLFAIKEPVILIVVVTSATILLSTASWLLIERRALALKNKVA